MSDGCVIDSVTSEIGMVDHPNHPLVYTFTFLPVLPSLIDFTAPSISTLPHHFPPTEFQSIGTGRFCNPFVLSIFQLDQYRGFGFCFNTSCNWCSSDAWDWLPEFLFQLELKSKISKKIPGFEKIVPLNFSAPPRVPGFGVIDTALSLIF